MKNLFLKNITQENQYFSYFFHCFLYTQIWFQVIIYEDLVFIYVYFRILFRKYIINSAEIDMRKFIT